MTYQQTTSILPGQVWLLNEDGYSYLYLILFEVHYHGYSRFTALTLDYPLKSFIGQLNNVYEFNEYPWSIQDKWQRIS